MDTITLKFTGRAKSKDNYKMIGKFPDKKTGKYYTFLSQEYKLYEKNLRRQAQAQLPEGWQVLTSCVWVSLLFYFKNKVHTDVINLPKSICDAMTGILWKDDRQVWLKLVYPTYAKGREEGFEMTIESVKGKRYENLDEYGVNSKTGGAK